MPGLTARTVGIDHCSGLGRIFTHQVMVYDHDLKANIDGRGYGVIGRRTAINRNDQFSTLILQSAKGHGTGTIAFKDPVRHIDGQILAHGAKPPHKLSRA